MSGLDVNRREFLKITAGAGAALTMPTLRQTAVASSSKMIGIQVGAISFVDEGTEKVLDVLQERA
ncbi:MAG TPA: twin-arginine translocation signal domain-containing protein, partial [Candidatus Sulfotelmatobacter sp.]